MAFRRIVKGVKAVSECSTVFSRIRRFANHLPDPEIEEMGAGKNILRPPRKRMGFEIMIKNDKICVNNYLPAVAARKMDGKISFDKRGKIVNLSKILTDREKVRKKGDNHVFCI
jgi:hypothetical protein